MIINSKPKIVAINEHICDFHKSFPDIPCEGCTCSWIYVYENEIWDFCADCDPDNPKCEKCIGC